MNETTTETTPPLPTVPQAGDFLICYESGTLQLIFNSEGDFVDLGYKWFHWPTICDRFFREESPEIAKRELLDSLSTAATNRLNAGLLNRFGDIHVFWDEFTDPPPPATNPGN